ncbi:MAG: phosphotransferase [Bacteroidales bacterium]|nr:phosphotransferase [Bacteroidales bacterium]
MDLISAQYKSWCKEEVEEIITLPESGSYRKYFRVKSKSKNAIAVINMDKKENIAFLEFTKHFLTKKLPVPDIFASDIENNIYLQEDLGDVTLFSYIESVRTGVEFSEELINIYKKVIDGLINFQINGAKDFNYSFCYPRNAFDKQSMMWDLNYFKYYFLKLAKIPFDEQNLENDFQKFTDFLLEADTEYFLYRDFQSRNIMLKGNNVYFIDYQGGRKGALQYDLASLLYDSKANIPQQIRNELVKYYINKLSDYNIDKEKFNNYYFAYVFIRIMQAMGAYGFRGFYEKKTHFLQSIPFAIENIKYLLETVTFNVEIPELLNVLNLLTQSEELMKFKNAEKKLTVNIKSFSYKKGLPEDKSGNGGGFIFDCRAVNNPGRYEKYVNLTGKDKEVIDFFEQEEEMTEFLENVYSIVNQSVKKYIKRGFSNLMVSFGCTGGQHRSVYSAEMLKKHLEKNYNINIEIQHREQNF